MKLFYGAIGQAYLDFYEPRISAKDELELLTGVNIKKVVRENINDEKLYYDDIIYKEMDIELKFCNDRNSIESIRKVKAIINKEDIKKISKHIIWTGSAYDGTKLWQCQGDDEDVSIVETSKNMPYTYDIMFKNQTKKGDKLNYSIITYLKDERNVMEPYFAHMIKHKIETLIIRIIAPKRLIKEVRTTIYADLDMSLNVSEESIKEIENTENEVIYQIKIQNANVNYTYAIEWSF